MPSLQNSSKVKSYDPIVRTNSKTAAYAPWQLNLFSGCSHWCVYCYMVGTLHKTREELRRDYATPFKHTDLEKINKALSDMGKDGLQEEPVLLSFLGDPYDKLRVDEGKNGLVREVLQLFKKHGQRFTVLTKNPEAALADLDLYGPMDALATTLTWWEENMEPFAPPVNDRVKALLVAQERRVKVWASLEPVGSEKLTLEALHSLEGLPTIQKFIGPEQRKQLSPEFLDEALKIDNTFVKGTIRPDEVAPKIFPAPKLEHVPPEMRASRRWIVWKLEQPEGRKKATKPPYNPKTGLLAEPDNPATWSSFDEAVEAYNKGGYAGLGFFMGWDQEHGINFCGVDLDHLEGPDDWRQARQLATRFDTYAEISPSEAGIHIIGLGKKDGPKCKKGNIEIYDHGRYFTFTGNLLDGKYVSVKNCEPVLRAFYVEVFGEKIVSPQGINPTEPKGLDSSPATSSVATLFKGIEPTKRGPQKGGRSPSPSVAPSSVSPSGFSDDEIIERLMNDRNGPKFRKLFAGDTSDYSSPSEADSGYAAMVRFYTRDPAQIKRIMLRSELKREKWDRKDYLDRTVGNVLKKGEKENWTVWTPPKGKGKSGGSKKSLAALIADAILDSYILRVVKETGTVLVREDAGGWREMEERELGSIAQSFGGRDKTTPAVLKDVYSKIEHEKAITISLKDFERRPDLLMDANGVVFSSLTREVVDITGDEFKDVFVIHKIGAVFDPSAPVPPEYLKVEKEILPNKQERLTFQEHVGTGFLRTNEFHKLYGIVGDTRDGKTTLFKIVQALAGKENFSTVTLRQMGMPYHTFKMWKMLFNFMDDISNESLRMTEFFKGWLGDGVVNIMKKYGMPIEVRLYCKGLGATNLLAASSNKNDQGYYSKWILASAPNTFLLDNQLTNEERETGILEPNHYHADPELVEKLISDPRKLSGILNHFLDGLARVKKNGCYSLKMTLEEERVRYDSMATPLSEVEAFMNMITRKEDKSKETRKADIFRLLEIYLQARKIPPISMTTFNDGLKEIGIGDKDRSRKAKDTPPVVALEDAGSVNPAVLRGVSLKKGWEEMLSGWRALIEMDKESELLED